MVRTVFVLSYVIIILDIPHTEHGARTLITPTGARPRPPTALVRIRACWNASAAMSDTNFCAANDRRRFLGDAAGVEQPSEGRVNKVGDLQTRVVALNANALQEIIRNFIRNLGEY